ncbi:hypothetical protein N9O57_01285 [bacterium]|nr:hypothetical protein [bacterium]
MLSYKRLGKKDEFEEFATLYKNSFKGKDTGGVYLEPEYFAKKTIVTGVYEKGEMVAGYVINDTPDLCLDLLSGEQREEMETLAPIDLYFDLSHIWKKKGFSRAKFNSNVWPRIVFDTLKYRPLKKKRIVGYVLTGHGRRAGYNKTKPLYHRTVEEGINVFSMTRKGMFVGFTKAIFNDVFGKPIDLTNKGIKKVIGNFGESKKQKAKS